MQADRVYGKSDVEFASQKVDGKLVISGAGSVIWNGGEGESELTPEVITDEQAAEAARRMLGNPSGGTYQVRRVSYDMRRGRADRVCSVICELDDPVLERALASVCSGAQYQEKKVFSPSLGRRKMERMWKNRKEGMRGKESTI